MTGRNGNMTNNTLLKTPSQGSVGAEEALGGIDTVRSTKRNRNSETGNKCKS